MRPTTKARRATARQRHLLLCLLATILVLPACERGRGGRAAGGAAGKALTLAVIPKGTTHEFWKSVHAGAVKAARELNAQGTKVNLIWKGPLREDDREQQVEVVEGFISQGVDGIVLAPLDERALVRPVEEAKRAGVPTVVFDSQLLTDSIVSFVATDNFRGGVLAADRLGEVLRGKGKALVMRYAEGSASTEQREAGFLQELKAKYPGVQIVSSDQYAGATRETAKRTAENLLNRFGADLQGVFTPNETSTVGMLLALQDFGKAGNVRFVGFDASGILVQALRDHQLDGLVSQNPVRMGYLGVSTMVAYIQGKKVEKRVDTGVTLVTNDNIDQPAVHELLNPPLAKYLGRNE